MGDDDIATGTFPRGTSWTAQFLIWPDTIAHTTSSNMGSFVDASGFKYPEKETKVGKIKLKKISKGAKTKKGESMKFHAKLGKCLPLTRVFDEKMPIPPTRHRFFRMSMKRLWKSFRRANHARTRSRR